MQPNLRTCTHPAFCTHAFLCALSCELHEFTQPQLLSHLRHKRPVSIWLRLKITLLYLLELLISTLSVPPQDIHCFYSLCCSPATPTTTEKKKKKKSGPVDITPKGSHIPGTIPYLHSVFQRCASFCNSDYVKILERGQLEIAERC